MNYYRLISTMSRSATANPHWDGLLAYYKADNTPNDALGTYNGTLVNGATYATGKINQGFSLDGVNDYVDLGSWFRLSKTNPFTVSCWVKISTNSQMNIISNGRDDGHQMFMYLNKIYFQIGFDTTSYLRIISTSTIPNNTFTHISITYNGTPNASGFKIYINGVSNTVVLATNTLGSNDTPSPSSGNLNIGRRPTNQYYFLGVIDELAILNREITSTEVTELYNAGAGLQYPN